MSVLRLANGSDLTVKLAAPELIEALNGSEAGDDAFVELPGESGPVLVRPSGVLAIIEDSRRGTAGFRIGSVASGAG